MCPKCGSDKIQVVTNTRSKGFGAGKGVIGFCLLGTYRLSVWALRYGKIKNKSFTDVFELW